MDRTIKPSEIKAVVETAYNKYKDFKVAGAAPDPRVSAMNPGKMSVSVCLTDGTRFGYGDTEAAFAMGSMMRIPMYIQLYSQNESSRPCSQNGEMWDIVPLIKR